MATVDMTPEPAVDKYGGIQKALTALAILFSAYMVYATLFGPYRTTLVHLSLFLGASFTLYFLKDEGTGAQGSLPWRIFNWFCAATAISGCAYVVIEIDRILASWGAAFMTRVDLMFGAALILVVLEAARRESRIFFTLSLIGIAYILYGNYLGGVFGHPGMDLQRFIYLTAFTAEGIFGFGLDVAATYLFMFMLLSASMAQTKTGSFIINLCNAGFGRHVGGPAKSCVVASAGLGTMVGSSIGNVVATGTFTIPLMKRSGFSPEKAGSVETVASEGAQFLPPIMGAGAFIMAEMTGVPYATIALAALLPALLYYVSIFTVVHIEAVRMGLKGMPENEIPKAGEVLRDGWHLLLPPLILFYLLMVEGMSPSYAGMISIGVSILVSMLRPGTRLNLTRFIAIFDSGARSTAILVALITAVGFIQQAVVTTGLGPRLSEIIIAFTGGGMFVTLLLGVVTATIVGMGMPTPIAYVLLGLFVAPALIDAGVPLLAAHLFLFYFAIKSGSTPPVAMVAIVAASIAKADIWKTSIISFLYSVPGFIIAFMFVYSPELLFQGEWYLIAKTTVFATIGTIAICGALQGWMGWYLNIPERLLIAAGSVCLVHSGFLTDAAGTALVAASLLLARRRAQKSGAHTTRHAT